MGAAPVLRKAANTGSRSGASAGDSCLSGVEGMVSGPAPLLGGSASRMASISEREATKGEGAH
eukprot:8905428-Prorocentrum_lima.AAC.1